MDFIKPKMWSGEDLEGVWDATLKIDGVRVLIDEGGACSRAGKPLPGLQYYYDKGFRGDFEFYTGDWDETVSLARNSNTKPYQLRNKYLYSLDIPDTRLHHRYLIEPTKEDIQESLEEVLEEGYEGLVLRKGDEWLKVKKEETLDIPITGIVEGTGRNKGRLGAFETALGNVGSGLTDKQREEYFTEDLIGTYIEVKYMELTKEGKLRQPIFLRLRDDK